MFNCLYYIVTHVVIEAIEKKLKAAQELSENLEVK
jgi:hypothetical protein